jgi:hypothetical protein
MPGYVKPEMIIFLVAAVSGICGGWMAANRGRNFLVWSILAGLLPVLLLVVYFSKPLCQVEGKFKVCPNCREFIRWEAPVCKYCRQIQPPLR